MYMLSIIVPAFNESLYINRILKKILNINITIIGFDKEIIVVDDGSTDDTLLKVKKIASKHSHIKIIHQDNLGKGRAVQRGIQESCGDYILVQDADLEYDPIDYIEMLKSLNDDDIIVYGSRILGQIKFENKKYPFVGKHSNQSFGPWLTGILLTFLVLILYGRFITDTLTGYKIYPKNIIQDMNIVTNGFETDHEITAKLINKNIKIVEIPIHYNPRTVEDGKKIKINDAFKAIWTFLRFRF